MMNIDNDSYDGLSTNDYPDYTKTETIVKRYKCEQCQGPMKFTLSGPEGLADFKWNEHREIFRNLQLCEQCYEKEKIYRKSKGLQSFMAAFDDSVPRDSEGQQIGLIAPNPGDEAWINDPRYAG